MNKVFVVQDPHHMRDGELVSKFNLSPAERYGELVYLLSPSAKPFQPDHIVIELREKLDGFNNDDYLLLIGNPCLMGFAVAIAANVNDGCVNVLQWHGIKREYIPVRAVGLMGDPVFCPNCRRSILPPLRPGSISQTVRCRECDCSIGMSIGGTSIVHNPEYDEAWNE